MIDKFNMTVKQPSETYLEYLNKLRALSIPAKIRRHEVKNKLLATMLEDKNIDFIAYS